MKRSLLVLFALTAFAAFAEKRPFERYQSIVDRQMFGALPPGFDPTKAPSEVSKADQKQLTQEQEKLQSAIRFSVINLTPEGETAVGFTDNTDPKSPAHYYLKVGESRNGWTVKSADPDSATMTIAKGEIEVSLSIGGNSAQDAGATSKAASASTSASGGRNLLAGGLLGGVSLRSRRLLREQKEREAKEKADAAAAEREAERQIQAEAERAQQEAERAEQRQQLQAIRDELKRVREAKALAKDEEPAVTAESTGNEGN